MPAADSEPPPPPDTARAQAAGAIPPRPPPARQQPTAKGVRVELPKGTPPIDKKRTRGANIQMVACHLCAESQMLVRWWIVPAPAPR